jgi:hypothetical protein
MAKCRSRRRPHPTTGTSAGTPKGPAALLRCGHEQYWRPHRRQQAAAPSATADIGWVGKAPRPAMSTATAPAMPAAASATTASRRCRSLNTCDRPGGCALASSATSGRFMGEMLPTTGFPIRDRSAVTEPAQQHVRRSGPSIPVKDQGDCRARQPHPEPHQIGSTPARATARGRTPTATTGVPAGWSGRNRPSTNDDRSPTAGARSAEGRRPRRSAAPTTTR